MKSFVLNHTVSQYLKIFSFLLLATGYGSVWAQDDEKIIQTIFFIGDAGEPYDTADNEPVGTVLRNQVRADPQATVVYLGDNVYPGGLPDGRSRKRKASEEILRAQVSWISGLNVRGIFIPGNHDWNRWGRKGLRFILNQQQWIDSLHDKSFVLLPRQACPGPVELSVHPKLLLVILDTQWFLHQWAKPGEGGGCDAKTADEAFIALDNILQQNKGKRVIIAGHHPLITYGDHGGVFTWKDHIFPLTDLHPKLYIPLPVVGSFYPLYRKLFGHIQDTTHPVYEAFIKDVSAVLKKYPGSIYVSGHEHALEYIVKDGTHQIVSGSGAKITSVRKKGFAKFVKGVRGFVKCSVYDNEDVSVHFIQADDRFPQGKEIYKVTIRAVP